MKTIVMTGASSGIGAVTKRKLEAEGNKVINIDLRDGDISVNLATPEGRKAAVDFVFQRFPEGIDGLVCCAGVSGACGNFKLMVSLNFYGAVSMAEGLFPLLQKKKGYCVLISSFSIAEGYAIKDIVKLIMEKNSEETVLGVLETMDSSDLGLGSAVYITAKYAVSLWIKRHAASWGARGVHINCIAPGTTNTPMVGDMDEVSKWALSALPVPIKYGESLMLEPDEVADVILFLLSPQSRGIHGTMIFVDGGTEAVINTEHVY